MKTEPQFESRCDHYVDESRCARKAHRYGEHHFPVGDWVVIYSGTPDPTESNGDWEPPEHVKPIGWYRTMTAKFATAHFGFPDGNTWRYGEQHKAPDGGVWTWFTDSGNWELSYYPPVDKEKGKNS